MAPRKFHSFAGCAIATGGGGTTHEARANAAAARLEGFSVVFVKELRTRFLRTGEREDGFRGEEDITAVNGATGSLFFVREVGEWVGGGYSQAHWRGGGFNISGG